MFANDNKIAGGTLMTTVRGEGEKLPKKGGLKGTIWFTNQLGSGVTHEAGIENRQPKRHQVDGLGLFMEFHKVLYLEQLFALRNTMAALGKSSLLC